MLKGNSSSGHYENPFSLEPVDNLTTNLQKIISSFIEQQHYFHLETVYQMICNCPKLGDDHSTY